MGAVRAELQTGLASSGNVFIGGRKCLGQITQLGVQMPEERPTCPHWCPATNVVTGLQEDIMGRNIA